MQYKIYKINSFANDILKGNPAAVVPLVKWPPKNIMQKIATENNVSETAFFYPHGDSYHIRWFSPNSEVDLCGHATLASAFVIFNHINKNIDEITFYSKSDRLSVTKNNKYITLNFPNLNPLMSNKIYSISKCLNIEPIQLYKNLDYMAVFNSENEIKNIKPKIDLLKKINLRGLIVTAPGDNHDFVSRFFVPKLGVNEDPVTGSTHSQLIPYWSKRLNKKKLRSKQISTRGGEVLCEQLSDRVLISGLAYEYLTGIINV